MHAIQTNRRRAVLAVLALLITVLLGPLAGGLLFLVPLVTGLLAEGPLALADTVPTLLSMALLVEVVALLMGLPASVPAGVAIAWRVARRGRVTLAFLLGAAAAGGVIGALWLALLTERGLAVGPVELAGRLLQNAVISLLAALVLLPLLRYAGIVPLRRSRPPASPGAPG